MQIDVKKLLATGPNLDFLEKSYENWGFSIYLSETNFDCNQEILLQLKHVNYNSYFLPSKS